MRNSYDTRALCLRALPPAFMFHPIRKGPLTYFLLFFFSKHFHVQVALKIGGRRGFIFISAGTLAAMRLAVIGEELFFVLHVGRYCMFEGFFSPPSSQHGNVLINPHARLSPVMG